MDNTQDKIKQHHQYLNAANPCDNADKKKTLGQPRQVKHRANPWRSSKLFSLWAL